MTKFELMQSLFSSCSAPKFVERLGEQYHVTAISKEDGGERCYNVTGMKKVDPNSTCNRLVTFFVRTDD